MFTEQASRRLAMSRDAIRVSEPYTVDSDGRAGLQQIARLGSNWRPEQRLWPLYDAARVADRVAAREAREAHRRDTTVAIAARIAAGIAVVIPEREAPHLWSAALSALVIALRGF